MSRKKKKLCILCAVLVLVLLVVPFSASMIIYESIFADRCEPDPLYARSPAEFEGLKAADCRFASDDGQMLTGYCYYYTDTAPHGVVILAHGLGGGGQSPYLSLSNYFAENGYYVFTYDATGNGQSEGEDANGFPQGTIDLNYAIEYVEQDSRFSDLPIVLFGHSWGAYSCGCVLNEHPEIRAVVSAAGPDDSIDMIGFFGEQHAGPAAAVLLPYLSTYEYLKFGTYSTYTCCEGFEKSDCGVMILHSSDDTVIDDEISCEVYRKKFGTDSRFTFIEYDDRGHSDLFYTDEALAYRSQFVKELSDVPKAQKASFIRTNFDEQRAYALDEALMQQILSFYDTYTK